jgi:hypothetical protein
MPAIIPKYTEKTYVARIACDVEKNVVQFILRKASVHKRLRY